MDISYKIPSTAIIHELLDNEIIIANLDTGVYYSIRHTGVPVWLLCVSHQTLAIISEIAAQHYDQLSHEQLSIDLTQFLNTLLCEGLLIPTSATTETQTSIPASLIWPKEYTAPLLEKYEDMQNLLMLDPIHEVDEQGWPSKL